MAKLLYVFMFLLIGSCSQKKTEQESDIFFIISNKKIPFIPTDPSEPPSPPRPFYTHFNFIVTNNSKVYLFINDSEYLNCEPNEVESLFSQLVSQDMVEIRSDTLLQFLQNTYGQPSINRKYADSLDRQIQLNRNYLTTIISSSDTIMNGAVKTLMFYFDDRGFPPYFLRKCTQQEERVIRVKIQKRLLNKSIRTDI